MEEKWKDTNYPNYEVSDLGRVRNKETILRKTYNIVVINGRFRNVAVMVLEAFKNVSMHNRKVYYRDDDDSNCELSNLSYKPFKKKKKKEKKKKIVQLSAKGRYITTFPSIEKIPIGSHHKIMAAVNNWKNRTYLGFRWLYFDDYANAVMSNSLHDSIENKGDIIQLTLDGDYINTYQSGYEAAASIGNPNLRGNIILVCKGKKKTCGGFKWMFKDDYMNERN